MATSASELLSQLSPVKISLGNVLYHPEAIAVGMQPRGALDSVRHALREATGKAVGGERIIEGESWTPHVTVAYSTAVQPASPIIAALGRKLPGCEAAISSVNLIVQEGAERLWNWRSIAQVPFGV